MTFADRREAGRRLGAVLRADAPEDPVVLGLPRGGVPVAYEVARALGAPLDVLVVRKLGCPWQPELGLGAIGEGGVRVLNHDLIRRTGVTPAELDEVAVREDRELRRRTARYRRGRESVELGGRTVLVVDDGLATGSTARAGIAVARGRGAAAVWLAVPVGAPDTVTQLADVADRVICLEMPRGFAAIGPHYLDFSQVDDAEVTELLASATRWSPADDPTGPTSRTVDIPVDRHVTLRGDLTVPAPATGLVVFAHGSGSSRLSPRNRAVAAALNASGLGTLLFDLLTVPESGDRRHVFDIELLAERLVAATVWLRGEPVVTGHPIGYFGASTGAAAALWAAADLGTAVSAVVSRGGRPDLARTRLAEVRAPTLLIVGGRDNAVLELNEEARQLMRCPTHLEVVPGATHLFEEPGTLDAVARLASSWFTRHLAHVTARSSWPG